ncbi:MAG TPA: crotonase/enoyl-CoA hydratase family protein [Mycobacteriales bacterium]|nr:crotonase/enoyl-CoA hydratase family protein [Mycobacteriales bacterium]
MSEVLTERRGNVLVITLNRPEAKNAINEAVAQQMVKVIDELDADPELRVGVLTGAGGVFCAGMDLKGFLRGENPTVAGRGFGGLTQQPPQTPLIAAVEGWALAGGFELVLSCDLVVASREAKFGIPEVKRSLVAGAGGLLRLQRRIPYHAAMELALTGEPIDAETAQRYGLVNRLTDPGGAVDAALELAEAICANGPLAVVATKRILRDSLFWGESESWSKQAEIMGPVFVSEDAREGATAFAERRAPVWKGR